ncbi:DUF3105 domain-containing protein [Pseudolysinimonas yzui]|uniref:DUF3105 domain-containing protein n=1 Tax=Pseudolysinimonas yzui TaxID=2708254 RepID=A0A8J3GQ69_9MICO|nr:DUF3105 domain-containing protein [Pseudolysinimonas yzui]GHF14167.1 hypothetical protein GCM10011600_13870 [Pseudolysinimonas yzui]
MATPPDRPDQPTIKEQRAQKRAAQLEAFKKKEAAAKRNRLLGIIAAVVALVLVVGTVATVLVLNSIPSQREVISGDYEDRLQLYPDLDATHTDTRVSYDQSPPVGGPHNPAWLNCGVYDEEQQNENVVHTLEHGAVWIAYDPATTTDDEIAALIALAPDTYTVISPYEGLGDAKAISAWGAQRLFTEVDDPAVEDFLNEFWRSPSSPEPNASCTGGVDGPGRVS